MEGEDDGGPSKRPRVDECTDLAEHEEVKQLREAMEELKGMVECPVCYKVPRQGGPLPVCSNGHFLCLSCRDRIRQEALDEEAKCPSCMVNLGNNTSLLASRLLEKVKHECEEEDCEEMIPFHDLEKHKKVCLFRDVLCPGQYCKLKIPFSKVEEHSRACAGFDKAILDINGENNDWPLWVMSEKDQGAHREILKFWPTKILSAHGRTFFVMTKRRDQYRSLEIVMLGNEEECKDFLASTTVLDKDDPLKVFTKHTSRPRPISLENWGIMGLMLSEDALWQIPISPETTYFAYKMRFSVEKV